MQPAPSPEVSAGGHAFGFWLCWLLNLCCLAGLWEGELSKYASISEAEEGMHFRAPHTLLVWQARCLHFFRPGRAFKPFGFILASRGALGTFWRTTRVGDQHFIFMGFWTISGPHSGSFLI